MTTQQRMMQGMLPNPHGAAAWNFCAENRSDSSTERHFLQRMRDATSGKGPMPAWIGSWSRDAARSAA
jgi:hypothetical protein